MSQLSVIARLESMLRVAMDIIEEQEKLLTMHGIDDRRIAEGRQKLKNECDGWC